MNQWRINLVFIFISIFSATIIGRLIYIQIISHQYWRALAQGQQEFFADFQGERGEIFFQNKEPLAKNRDFDFVYISPNEIEKPEETAEALSLILNNTTYDLILEKIKKDSFYALLKKKLTEEELSNLKKLNLAGIYLGVERGRYYPLEFFASQIIGFLGGDGKGQYGIEGYYDDILRGKDYNLSVAYSQEFQGSDLVLTFDYNIQFKAEKLLEKAKEDLDIEGGEIIVVDPNSGKILALANFPNFNPNQYQEYAKENNFKIFQNGATQKIFEPGSVFKPFTFAAALEEEKITPQTTYIDEGIVKIGISTINNYNNKVYGKQTMTQVLEKSINTGAVFVEEKLDHDIFLKYIVDFGIFTPTGIDLQGEEFSQNKEFKNGYEINFATASFGQGIEMTPIQLVRGFSAIANGGKLFRPYVVDKIIEPASGTNFLNLDGQVWSSFGRVIETQPEIQNPSIISQKTANQLKAMLVSVIENGFGKKAKIPGYYIAGKTGTAQVPFENKKGYYQDKTIQTFIGFAPAFNPRFLILVKLNNPKTKTAEYSAVPIFRNLAEYIINYWQIAPDYE